MGKKNKNKQPQQIVGLEATELWEDEKDKTQIEWEKPKEVIDTKLEGEKVVVFDKFDQVYEPGFYGTEESGERQEIREAIRKKFHLIKLEYMNRFSIHFLTLEDFNKMWCRDEGRGPIGKNIKSGRLLQNKQSQTIS